MPLVHWVQYEGNKKAGRVETTNLVFLINPKSFILVGRGVGEDGGI